METSVSALTTSVMVFLTVMITLMRPIVVSILMLKERLHLLVDASENFLYLLHQIIVTTVLKTSKFILGKLVYKLFFGAEISSTVGSSSRVDLSGKEHEFAFVSTLMFCFPQHLSLRI